MLQKVFLIVSLLFICIVGYGYWHASTHGWLYISIRDNSDQDHCCLINYSTVKSVEKQYVECQAV